MPEVTDLQDPFIRSLTCAAVTPGLRSVLVFDAGSEVLQAAAVMLAELLTAVTEKEVKTVRLGVSETDDDLWGHLALTSGQKDAFSDKESSPANFVINQQGLLTTGKHAGALLLVFIPDLTRLSLASMRGSVMLMGADVAHMERHGQQELWSPQICWLAGCRQKHIGQISPHILDRFALRLYGASNYKQDRVQAVLDWSNLVVSSKNLHQVKLSSAVKETLLGTVNRWAILKQEAIQQIYVYDTGPVTVNTRRQIALARMAQALARLDGVAYVEATHIDQAAQLIRLAPERQLDTPARPVDSTLPDTILDDASTDSMSEQPSPEITLNESLTSEQPLETPVYESQETPELLETASLPIPYPEDKVAGEREAHSLRFPIHRFRTESKARGLVIGVEPTTSLKDLALVGTLLAAAPYQRIRHKNRQVTDCTFILTPSDLRCYRRLPIAEQMLVLVLDYTCLNGIDWQSALLPYLGWAYIERVSIGIVQVGMAVNQPMIAGEIHPDELRARQILVPNLMAPRIEAAFKATPGRITPLAHGLDLAYQILRHSLQHGRHAIRRALLLVLTDGRGNVPLAASQSGRISLPTGHRGIEDTLVVAKKIRGLNRVDVSLLNPQPTFYAQLPLTLAENLGAMVEPIRRLDDIREEKGE